MDNNGADDEKNIKVVVCGDGSSGKTSICSRFAKETFDKNYHQTMGLDFYSRRLVMPGDVHVLLQVWDIGGQSIASEMIDKYIAGAQAALIVYDVTNMRSFDNVQDWLQVVKRVTKNEEKPPHIALVGNKTDLEQKRVVTVDAHNTLAKKHDMMPMYVSAKTGDSVLMLFRQTVADLLKIVLSKADQEADIVVVEGEIQSDAREARRRVDHSQNSNVCSVM